MKELPEDDMILRLLSSECERFSVGRKPLFDAENELMLMSVEGLSVVEGTD